MPEAGGVRSLGPASQDQVWVYGPCLTTEHPSCPPSAAATQQDGMGGKRMGTNMDQGPLAALAFMQIHFSLKCKAEERGIAAQPGVSRGLGFMLQLPEALSLVAVNSQHLLPPSFKKTTNQMSYFPKCLHSDPVFSLYLGQGELILHTYSFHQSSKKKQDLTHIPAICHILMQYKKIIGAE